MKTVVISLARAHERRAKIKTQLESIGAPFTFLDATDARELTAFERSFVDHRTRKAITPYPLSDGEIGCWYSHRRVMADLVTNGPDVVAVVEDDVTPHPDLPRVLAAIARSRVAFDFIDLHRVFRPSQTFERHSHLCDGYDIGWVRYTQMCTTGYVIRREGAEKFLNAVPSLSHAVDKSMKRWWANNLNYFVLNKPVVHVPRGTPSQIDAEGRAQRAPYPDADHMRWRLARLVTRASDSLAKRMQFSALRKRSRSLLQPVAAPPDQPKVTSPPQHELSCAEVDAAQRPRRCSAASEPVGCHSCVK